MYGEGGDDPLPLTYKSNEQDTALMILSCGQRHAVNVMRSTSQLVRTRNLVDRRKVMLMFAKPEVDAEKEAGA